MTRNPAVVTPLRPAARPGLPDTNALDDIQALLASRDRPRGEDAITEIREIIRMTGRSLVTPRLFSAETGTGSDGLPYAHIGAEGVVIRADQRPDADGVHVGISARDAREEAGLTVTVGGRHVFGSRHAVTSGEGHHEQR
jgi:hypothetical protein